MRMWPWERRRERDAEAAARVEEIQARAGSGQRLLYVETCYQYIQRGTKCFVVDYMQPSLRRDAFFYAACPSEGELYLVRSGQGWGAHTGRNDVLYVGDNGGGVGGDRHGIINYIDAGTLRRAERHWRRQDVEQRKEEG